MATAISSLYCWAELYRTIYQLGNDTYLCMCGKRADIHHSTERKCTFLSTYYSTLTFWNKLAPRLVMLRTCYELVSLYDGQVNVCMNCRWNTSIWSFLSLNNIGFVLYNYTWHVHQVITSCETHAVHYRLHSAWSTSGSCLHSSLQSLYSCPQLQNSSCAEYIHVEYMWAWTHNEYAKIKNKNDP